MMYILVWSLIPCDGYTGPCDHEKQSQAAKKKQEKLLFAIVDNIRNKSSEFISYILDCYELEKYNCALQVHVFLFILFSP